MDSRFFASMAIASMLVLGILATAAAATTNAAYAQTDDRWYVGEGAKQDMYVKYRIQEFDTNNNDPFEMTIYFKEQDADGNWIAPTFVQYRGNVYSGTMKLGDNLASLGRGSDIPDDLRRFVGAYGRSLQWLEAFTAKSRPLSLSQPSWGKIAAIGGEEIKPLGKEKVAVPAGTYDATLIGWHKGNRDNKIWVVNDFPYPVKAETYVEVASGNAPIQYAFSLLEVGMGEPELPTGVAEIPEPPLTQGTPRGTFEIELDWEPASIEPGKEVEFGLNFYDNNGFPLERVSYDFVVKDGSGETIEERANQFADFGTSFQKVTFEQGGGKTVTVRVNSVSGQGTGQFTEEVDFNIVVVPEFPVSAALIAAAVIGLAVAMTRLRGTSLGSMFGGRNGI